MAERNPYLLWRPRLGFPFPFLFLFFLFLHSLLPFSFPPCGASLAVLALPWPPVLNRTGIYFGLHSKSRDWPHLCFPSITPDGSRAQLITELC